MEFNQSDALLALAALAQPTRLAIFRRLVTAAPDGMAAGAVAEAVGCPANTLSGHIGLLARAGLVEGRRDGRSIVYRARLDGARLLVGFLMRDCCQGRPEVCGPIMELAASCAADSEACGCAPQPAETRQ